MKGGIQMKNVIASDTMNLYYQQLAGRESYCRRMMEEKDDNGVFTHSIHESHYLAAVKFPLPGLATGRISV